MAYITDNNGSKVSVTINDVSWDIQNILSDLYDQDWAEWYDESDRLEAAPHDENGNYSKDTLANCSYPLRLQVVDGSWFIHSGDPQYDTDHRGSWGYAYAYYGMNKTAIKALARELINDCNMW